MCASAISGSVIKSNYKTGICENQRKVDVWFTLQIAAVRNTFSVLRGFAIPLPPFSGVSSLLYLQPPGSPPAVFSYDLTPVAKPAQPSSPPTPPEKVESTERGQCAEVVSK